MSFTFIPLPDLNNNSIVNFNTDINNVMFDFSIRWNSFCSCAFLSIYDMDGNPIISSQALTTNSTIKADFRSFPKELIFAHINGLNYEPEISNFHEEFVLAYV